jgi:hypothetical protein
LKINSECFEITSLENNKMEYDKDKIDEMVLALLYLTSFPEQY